MTTEVPRKLSSIKFETTVEPMALFVYGSGKGRGKR